MSTNACYGGTHGAKSAPVIPSLLAAPMLQGVRHDHNSKLTAESFILGGRASRDTSCGGPCVRNELLDMAFGNEG